MFRIWLFHYDVHKVVSAHCNLTTVSCTGTTRFILGADWPIPRAQNYQFKRSTLVRYNVWMFRIWLFRYDVHKVVSAHCCLTTVLCTRTMSVILGAEWPYNVHNITCLKGPHLYGTTCILCGYNISIVMCTDLSPLPAVRLVAQCTRIMTVIWGNVWPYNMYKHTCRKSPHLNGLYTTNHVVIADEKERVGGGV